MWQALKVLRTAEYAPFVVFIAAPTIASFTEVLLLFTDIVAILFGLADVFLLLQISSVFSRDVECSFFFQH